MKPKDYNEKVKLSEELKKEFKQLRRDLYNYNKEKEQKAPKK